MMLTMHKQKGMVLALALILLIPLILIASALMQWSREDLKVVGAISDRNRTEQSLIGRMNEVMVVNNLAATLSVMPASSSVTTTSGTVVPLTLKAEITCKRRFNANADSAIKTCRYVDANSNSTYGKGNTGSLNITLNIEQPLLSSNGG